MTKSVIKAMDTVQAWASEYHQQDIRKFVVVGRQSVDRPLG